MLMFIRKHKRKSKHSASFPSNVGGFAQASQVLQQLCVQSFHQWGALRFSEDLRFFTEPGLRYRVRFKNDSMTALVFADSLLR